MAITRLVPHLHQLPRAVWPSLVNRTYSPLLHGTAFDSAPQAGLLSYDVVDGRPAVDGTIRFAITASPGADVARAIRRGHGEGTASRISGC